MIKTIVSIEESLKLNSEVEKYNFEASLMKRPRELDMNLVQLAQLVLAQSLKIYLMVLLSSCFSIFTIVFVSYPGRKINQLYQLFINQKFKTNKYEYTNC
jgi:hypothetical protein